MVSPPEIKGFSGQPVTVAGIFCGLWIPHGYSKFFDSLTNRQNLKEVKIMGVVEFTDKAVTTSGPSFSLLKI